MTIGKRIAMRRNELGMSQDELAKKLGYKSRSSINKIEKGGNELPQKKIVAFAYALDTTPEYIMGWYKAPPMEYSIRCDFANKEDYETMSNLLKTVNQLEYEDAVAVLDFAKFKLSQQQLKKEPVEGGEVV